MEKSSVSLNKNVKDLCLAAKEGRLPHAILLETDDIGKKGMRAALEITKALMCISESDKPCNKCRVCYKIANRFHPDVSIVSVKSPYKSIRVEDIRNLRQDVYLAPNESSYKVYIIYDGGLMNEFAQNILLKILEEPPQGVIFIILCNSEFSVIDTIKSRVQVYNIEESMERISSGKIHKVAKEFIDACISGNKFDIVKESAKIAKDRETFKNILGDIKETVVSTYISCPKETSAVKNRILKIVEIVDKARGLVEENVNNQLVACYMCVKLGEL